MTVWSKENYENILFHFSCPGEREQGLFYTYFFLILSYFFAFLINLQTPYHQYNHSYFMFFSIFLLLFPLIYIFLLFLFFHFFSVYEAYAENYWDMVWFSGQENAAFKNKIIRLQTENHKGMRILSIRISPQKIDYTSIKGVVSFTNSLFLVNNLSCMIQVLAPFFNWYIVKKI